MLVAFNERTTNYWEPYKKDCSRVECHANFVRNRSICIKNLLYSNSLSYNPYQNTRSH